jgi:hypothetical protein
VTYSVDFLDGKGFNALTIALAVIALIASIAGAYYAKRALAQPKLRLMIVIPEPTSLIATAGHSLGISVTLSNGTPLADPYLIDITVENTGSHAIESAMFDQGRPIRIELGTRIIAVTSAPPIQTSLARIDPANEQVLLIGPELIQKDQRYSFQVLTDGKPDAQDPESFIVGAEVVVTAEDYSPSAQLRNQIVRIVSTVGVAAATAALSALINIITK